MRKKVPIKSVDRNLKVYLLFINWSKKAKIGPSYMFLWYLKVCVSDFLIIYLSYKKILWPIFSAKWAKIANVHPEIPINLHKNFLQKSQQRKFLFPRPSTWPIFRIRYPTLIFVIRNMDFDLSLDVS